MTVKRCFIAGLILAGISPANADGDQQRGAAIANDECARCHVVSEARQFTGISSTPSFMMMVNNLADWEERYKTFYLRRPHQVHVRVEGIDPLNALPSNATIIHLTLGDIEDLVAYARTLRKVD